MPLPRLDERRPPVVRGEVDRQPARERWRWRSRAPLPCVPPGVPRGHRAARCRGLWPLSLRGRLAAGAAVRAPDLGAVRLLGRRAGGRGLELGTQGGGWAWLSQLTLPPMMLFCTGAFFSYKLLVLLVSLPMTDEPPSGWRRLLTVTTPVDLGGLVGESLASTAIGILWCLCGMMGFEYVVPLLAFTALLLLRMAVVFYDDTFLVELAHSSSSLIVLVFYTAKTAVSQPCAIFSPASVGFHIVAATVAFVIVLTCQAEDPLVMFLLAHSAVLFACVVENVCIRRLRWKAGRRWVLLVHVSLFVTYSANLLCELLPELVAVPPSWRVFAVSAAWLSLVLVLALTVNRGAFLEYYTSWQQLHGKFRLGRARPGEPQRQQRAARRPRPPPDAEGGLAGDAGGGGSTAAARHGAAPAAAAGARACEGHGAAVCL
ncbi:unnamed protein product [Prorocentrum cordatum]|uniref:Glycerophosphocholine acyltransferase 1 n=1 Tax=Prorocentrum cordatum TaxID=2364126 RepID=A0ABN9VP39_9DINO|nr:unnamed protein product [Polarella glacialis]